MIVSVDYEADEYHTEVTIEYDENQAPRPRYMDIMREALDQARANADPERRMRRSTSPKIAGVMPSKGSPKGGLLVTIYGENLRSKKIDLGGQESESDNEGENYNMWFEREYNGQTWKVPCTMDRMLQLHGRPIDGHSDFLVCETNEMPRFYTFYFKYLVFDLLL